MSCEVVTMLLEIHFSSVLLYLSDAFSCSLWFASCEGSKLHWSGTEFPRNRLCWEGLSVQSLPLLFYFLEFLGKCNSKKKANFSACLWKILSSSNCSQQPISILLPAEVRFCWPFIWSSWERRGRESSVISPNKVVQKNSYRKLCKPHACKHR